MKDFTVGTQFQHAICILSEVVASQREAATQSKDPCSLALR